MKKAIKKKWVKALRSGEFKRCAGVLGFNGHFCCLGVLRHIEFPRSRSSFNDENAFLSDRHLKLFGLTDDEQQSLASMNDRGASFNKIANWIEKNL